MSEVSEILAEIEERCSMKDIMALQSSLCEWTEAQFPSRNMHSILAHSRNMYSILANLIKETIQLEDEPKDIKEFADCLMGDK